MIDFSQIKFRASSWGNLLTEPVSKADKEAGKLSKTCQKELVKIYNMEVYGRKTEIVTKQMTKGVEAEDASIALFSMVEGKLFFKNTEKLENQWFTGHMDIFVGDHVQNAEEVWDTKTRWNMDSFMPKLVEEIDKGEELQLQVYFSLTGAKSGGIVNTLVSCPENLLIEEKRRLLYQMNVISELSPDYLKACEDLERSLVFEDIDPRERVIKQPVVRDDEIIEKMKAKCPIMRQWLQEFHAKHLSLYPKQ